MEDASDGSSKENALLEAIAEMLRDRIILSTYKQDTPWSKLDKDDKRRATWLGHAEAVLLTVRRHEADLDQLESMVKRAGYPAGVLVPAGPGAPPIATMSLLVFDRDDSAKENGAAWWAHFHEDGSLVEIKTMPTDKLDEDV